MQALFVLALEMASQGNQHCVNCIGALSFPIRMTGEFRLNNVIN